MPKSAVDGSMDCITVAELAARSGRCLREIIDYALGDSASIVAAAAGPVDTRTCAGRYAYDQTVFAALEAQGRPMSALELRERVGGTAQQLRAALGRLVEDEIVEATGQAAATRYALV